MKYSLLIYEREADWDKLSEADQADLLAAYGALTEDLKNRGQLVVGEPLQATTTASTLRLRAGKVLVTDGPFAETKEQLGGFYIVDVPDLDTALAIAARIPSAARGSIEVRPIQSYGG